MEVVDNIAEVNVYITIIKKQASLKKITLIICIFIISEPAPTPNCCNGEWARSNGSIKVFSL